MFDPQFGAFLTFISILAGIVAVGNFLRRWRRATGELPPPPRLLRGAVPAALGTIFAINVLGTMFGVLVGLLFVPFMGMLAVVASGLLPVPEADALPYFKRLRTDVPLDDDLVEGMEAFGPDGRRELLAVLLPGGGDHVAWCDQMIPHYATRMTIAGKPWAETDEDLIVAGGLNAAAQAEPDRVAAAILIAAMARHGAPGAPLQIAATAPIKGVLEDGIEGVLSALDTQDDPTVVVSPAGKQTVPIPVQLKAIEGIGPRVRALGLVNGTTPVRLRFSPRNWKVEVVGL
jgi:hypothetical protein